MLRLTGVPLGLDFTGADLKQAAAKRLRVPESALGQVRLVKKSVDARKKDKVCFICALEAQVRGGGQAPLPAAGTTGCRRPRPTGTNSPRGSPWPSGRWVVGLRPGGDVRRPAPGPVRPPAHRAGAGPAGGAAGEERGDLLAGGPPGPGEQRAVRGGRRRGLLRREAHHRHRGRAHSQGAGGAWPPPGPPRRSSPTPSPTSARTSCPGRCGPSGRRSWPWGERCGSPARWWGFRRKGGALSGLEVETAGRRQVVECSQAILAVGHSAGDVFRLLEREGLPLQAKAFSVGGADRAPQGAH